MFDKTIKLTGEYPSDFKPSVSVQEVQQYFDAYKFYDGRMLGGSKIDYRTQYPDDLIIFESIWLCLTLFECLTLFGSILLYLSSFDSI